MTELERRNIRALRYSQKCAKRRRALRISRYTLGGSVLCFLWALSLWAVALLAAR